jgi:DNA-binding LytR/AlgR family response regulator
MHTTRQVDDGSDGQSSGNMSPRHQSSKIPMHASYLLRESIGRLAERLDPDRFARIHRSTIVNVSKLRELQPCDSGEFIAVLKSGKALSCSRGYRPQIQRLIESIC